MQTRIDKTANLTLLLAYCFLAVLLFCGWSNTFNTSTPANSDSPTEAAVRMREIKAAIQEREDVDHYWELTSTQVSDTNTGEHRQVTFWNGIYPDPNLHIYPKTATAELYFDDAAGNSVQLTTEGYLFGGLRITMDTTGVLYNKTTDASDTGSTAVQSGGASSNNIGRGGAIVVYGNEHTTYPGQVLLKPGYSTGTTDANINATSHIIMNVNDPCSAQDAATKNYVDNQGIGNYSDPPTTITADVAATETDEVAATLAATNLLVYGTCISTGTEKRVIFKGYSDENANPTTIRGVMGIWVNSSMGGGNSFMMFVKKGEYYKITGQAENSSYNSGITRTYCTVPIGN